MSGPAQPPLWTWAAAAALAAASVAGLLAFDAATQPAFVLDGLSLGRLERPAKPGAARVVVLGTSKTKCAFPYDHDLDARFRAAGRPVSFTRIAVLGGAPSQLPYVLEPILKAKPALVLIESDLLLIQPGGYNGGDGPIEQVWQSRVRAKLKGLAGKRQPSPNDPDATAPCDARDTGAAEVPDAQYVAVLNTRRVSTEAERRPLLDLLAKVRAQGGQAGLIDIPTAATTERLIPARLADERKALERRLVAEHGLVRLSHAPLPAGDYVDRGHLNSSGRTHFTQWFVPEALRRLRTPDA